MVDENLNQNKLKKSSIASTIAAAVLLITSFTMHEEGTVYRAYQDPVGIWTICDGHTGGVRRGEVANKEQCQAYFEQDMTIAMQHDIKYTPKLVENKNALEAAGDFSFNAGYNAYGRSPMAKYFSKGMWNKGCNAFAGYYDTGTSSRPIRGTLCIYKPHKNKWSCKLPGLVTRRIKEKNICLGLNNPHFIG